jgi:Arc/MetJ-type ribon-helix-helix transcriptional regulator
MVTEMITLKLEDNFLGVIDDVVRREGFQNRTEFIRNALREKIDRIKLKNAMIEVSKLKGAAKKKSRNYEEARLKAFKELVK